MQVGVGVGNQVVGSFGGGIKANGGISRVALGEPFPIVVAINRTRRGKHEVLGWCRHAGLDDVLKAHDITADISAGILN